MLVEEQFRKCVTFLYKEVSSASGIERQPIGSAFFVRVRVKGDRWAVYAVTARHVVDGAGGLWLRMRTHDGSYKDLPVAPDAWEQSVHTDVAAALLLPASEDYDFKAVGLDEFADETFVRDHEVGEGDDLFFSGLFIAHYGRGVPQPIIRFGNVALMPREPVNVEISKNPQAFRDIEAYLTEARSWGGQSGSPAFLSFPAARRMGSGLAVDTGTPPFALLGMVQGIWKDPKAAKAPDPSGEGVIEVNMGISVVVPAYKITEVLMSERFTGERAEMAAQGGRGGSLVPPAATGADVANPEYTRFEELAQKLVNTPKAEIDEKRRTEES